MRSNLRDRGAAAWHGTAGILQLLALVAGCLAVAAPSYAQQACTSPAQCDDGIACTDDLCVFGFCVNLSTCTNGLFCDGIEVCCTDGIGCTIGTCVPGTPVSCNPGEECFEPGICGECGTSADCNDNSECTVDSCANGDCVFSNIADGSSCDNDDACTSNDQCLGGVCTGNLRDCQAEAPQCHVGTCDANSGCVFTPTSGGSCNDGDQCTAADTCEAGQCVGGQADGAVNLEFRLRSGFSRVSVGDLVEVDLFAVRNNTDVVNVSVCPTGQHAIAGLELMFSWDPQIFELANPALIGEPNPEDPCLTSDSCNVNCPGTSVGAYANPELFDGSNSVFPNDCAGDGVNEPCPGFPANDGTGYYLAFKHILCGATTAPPACVPLRGITIPGGLWVTTLKFRAIGVTSGLGAPAEIVLEGCIGQTRTKVVDGATSGLDTLGSLVQGPSITVDCVSDGDCPTGTPCQNGSCSSCQPPTAVSGGPRYLDVTPPPGSERVAILVTGVDPEVSCVSQYVAANGGLGGFPNFRTPSQWADLPADPFNDPTDLTVHVRGENLQSGMTYSVQLDCDPNNPGTVLSDSVEAKLNVFGDVDNNGDVDILDATKILDGFRAVFHTLPCTDDGDCFLFPPFRSCDQEVGRCKWITRENVDIIGALFGCMPNRDIEILDVVEALDAFRRLPNQCVVTCSP